MTDGESTTYNPEDRTQGLSKRECQHCGEYGSDHEKQRVYEDDGSGRYSYDYVCPTEAGS